VHEGVVTPRLLARNVIGDLEVADFAGDPGAQFGHIEGGDRPDAATPVTNGTPGSGDGISHRGNEAQAGDYYATR
jgi:hypothetical protein